MYFRQKNSKSGTVLQLIRSYRNDDGKPRQQVVCSLGNANIPEEDRSIVASRIDMLLMRQEDLFPIDLTPSQTHWVDFVYNQIQVRVKAMIGEEAEGKQDSDLHHIDIDKIEHTNSTTAGPEIVALEAWNELEMPQKLEELGFNSSQIHAATANVLNRLIDPVSENALNSWLTTSSLPDLLDTHFEGKNINSRFYRVCDQLYKESESIEKHLRQKQDEIWGHRNAIYLYDLTNTYFEGSASAIPEAQRGKSKEKRTDCPLISIAIAFSGDGLPRSHKFFSGNTNDGISFPEMLEQIEADPNCNPDSKIRPLFVMDAGIATHANLKLLRERGYDYLVNDNRGRRSQFQPDFELEKSKFEEIEGKGVQIFQKEYKWVMENEETQEEESWTEHILLCKSEQRKNKEMAILENACKKFEKEIESLCQTIERGRLKVPKKIHQRIGRIRQRHTKVSRFYELDLYPSTESESARLEWKLKEDWKSHLNNAGSYVLRSTTKFESSENMWHQYMSLTNVEDGFRCLKSDLGLRPIFHQTSNRCFGHLFISILALHLLAHIKRKIMEHGLESQSWETIKRTLSTHCYSTLIIPVKNGGTYHIRKVGNVTESQRSIYEAMGITWTEYRQALPIKKIFKS